MKYVYCQSCGKKVGYIKPTGIYDYGIEHVKQVNTHCQYKKVLAFPNAKIEEYKYTTKLICDFCNRNVN